MTVIMIIDDDKYQASVYAHMCNNIIPNCTAIDFNDSCSAYDSLSESKVQYDLIVLDLLMPDVKGTEFITKIRKINHDVPILVITGCDSVKLAADAIKAGAQALLHKQEDVGRIRETIEQYLRK